MMSNKDKKHSEKNQGIPLDSNIQEDCSCEKKMEEQINNVNNMTDEQPNEVEKLSEELKHEKEKYLRLFAEFDNYKKRITKQTQDFNKYKSQTLLEAIIPVIDDFERAVKELEKEEENPALEGIKLIYNKLLSTLKDKGVSKIEGEQGEDFNVDLHEAITQIQVLDDSLKGKIIDYIEPGYTLYDKVVRYAKVVVGK